MSVDLSKYAISNSEEHFTQAEQSDQKPTRKKRSEDERFWKPNIRNPKKEYQAMVRALPRDPDPQSKRGFCVRQDVFYIKDEATGVFLYAKSRKSLGDKEKCPIDEYNWSIYNKGKQSNNQALMDLAYNRKPTKSFIGNFLVQNDLVNPQFNGQVKLWEHTARMNKFITDPMKSAGVVLNPQVAFGQTPETHRFIPYDLVNGHNLIVHMSVNPENGIPTYDNSFWEQEAKLVANTGEDIEAILANLHSLDEFMDDIPTVEELNQKLQEFNDKVAQAGGNVAMGNSNMYQGGFGQPQGQAQPFQQPPMPQGVSSQQISVDGFNQAAQPIPESTNVSQGNSDAFFNGATPTTGIQSSAPVNAPEATPTQPLATSMPESSGEPEGEDDLPF